MIEYTDIARLRAEIYVAVFNILNNVPVIHSREAARIASLCEAIVKEELFEADA